MFWTGCSSKRGSALEESNLNVRLRVEYHQSKRVLHDMLDYACWLTRAARATVLVRESGLVCTGEGSIPGNYLIRQ